MRNKITVKERILLILEENKGTTISGEALARALGVSRAAVWKAMHALAAEGYDISAGTNKGYCLDSNSDILSMQGIKSYIMATPQPNIFVYDKVDSTNKAAKKLVMDGYGHGTCVIANQQSEGRGRLGRSFYSPSGTGIYLSIILKPDIDMSRSTLVTTMSSVAVARAISSVCGVDADIKWVNDLYYMDKKICGILTEAVTNFESGEIDFIIVGIGINCGKPPADMPDDLKSVMGYIPGSSTYSRNQLTAEVINNTMDLCEDLESGSFLKEYKKRSMVIGKDILVYKSGLSGEALPAKAIDINDKGGLLVKYDTGKKEVLSSGEVSIRLS